MKKTESFAVKKVTSSVKGHTYRHWKVEGRINGVRYRKFFTERALAEGHKSEMEIKALNEAQVVRTTVSHLTAEQLRDAESAFLRLDGQASLVATVDWYKRTFRETLTKLTCAEAWPLFLADREPHLRRTTYQDYKSSLTRFSADHGSKKLPEVTAEDVIAFLTKLKVSGKSWNNIRADLSAFFAWAEKSPRKWITSNPVKDVEVFKISQGMR